MFPLSLRQTVDCKAFKDFISNCLLIFWKISTVNPYSFWCSQKKVKKIYLNLQSWEELFSLDCPRLPHSLLWGKIFISVCDYINQLACRNMARNMCPITFLYLYMLPEHRVTAYMTNFIN